jgi:hypothetical protein
MDRIGTESSVIVAMNYAANAQSRFLKGKLVPEHAEMAEKACKSRRNR